MLVIFLMAGNASGWRYHFFLNRRCVAVIAVQALVSAVELESSPFVVVEVPNFPVP